MLGDVLTVAGLVGITEVLPRMRPLTRYAPDRYRAQLETVLPDDEALKGQHGALGRNMRTFMVEQRALTAELPTVAAHLGDLDLPVSVVSGDWDIVVPPRAAESLARAVPGAELTYLPRAGHFAARDDPQGLAEIIRRTSRARLSHPRP